MVSQLPTGMSRLRLRSRTGAVAILATLLALLVAASPAVARIGVGVDTGSIKVDQALVGSNTYRLASVGVVNTGDTTLPFAMRTSTVQQAGYRTPPASWISFEPTSTSIKPSAKSRFTPTITPPRNAAPGRYIVLLEAYPVFPAAKGPTIQGAAATQLTFEVASVPLERRVSTRVVWLTVLGMLVAFVAVFLRRFRFGISIERRSGG